MMRSRLAAVAAVVALAAAVLSGCQAERTITNEQWLADRDFVLDVEHVDPPADAPDGATVLRAELDPLATTKDIQKLIADTVDRVRDHPEPGQSLQFGMLGVDFAVTTRADTETAFELWRDIDYVRDLDTALVTAAFITADTGRDSLVAVFDQLSDFGVGVRVNGTTAGVESPVAIVLESECEPPGGARDLAKQDSQNELVRFATYDLCEGFDVVYGNGTVFDEAINGMLGSVDAAGLGEFPVRLAVAPTVDGSPEYHIVEATPGNRDAIGVVTALDASEVLMRYELRAPAAADEPRELRIETTAATLEELYELLLASPAAQYLGELRIRASDREFGGTLEELGDLIDPPKPTSTPTPSP